MSAALRTASLRHFTRHPWITTLSMAGVALGVAVVVAIDQSGRSSQASFELATETVTGRATHQVVGGPTGVPEEFYARLRIELGLRESAPVLEGTAVARESGRRLTLLGVDPLAEGSFRSYSPMGFASRGLLADFLVDPAATLLVDATAEALGLSVGETFDVTVGGRAHRLRLIGTIDPTDPLEARGAENLLLVDVATAQEMLGLSGRLSRIDLRLDDGPLAASMLERIEAELPPGTRLRRAETRSESAGELTSAFRLNLLMLSLMALMCGGFLIYNSVTFSVVTRRGLFGTLRALGVTRGQILRLVLLEALVIGAIGSLLGIGLGQLLARALIGMVAQTISDFYFAVSVTDQPVDPASLARGFGLGLLVSLAAALWPAREATTVAPRQALLRSELERGSRRGAGTAAIVGLGAIALGALALWALPDVLWVSFMAIFAILLGCALATPLTLRLASRLLAPILGGPLGSFGRMAARGLESNLSRTGVAVAALMLALSVTIGVGLMISSFRTTVERWLESYLPADLYVLSTAPDNDETPATRIEPASIEAIRDLPGIARVNVLRRTRVETTLGEALLLALDLDARSHGAFTLKQGEAESAWGAYHEGRAVLVSEPFAFRTGLVVGSEIGFETARGPSAFVVGGVFYDYSTDRGYVLMDLARYRELWGDPGITAASTFVEERAELETMAEAIRDVLPSQAPLLVSSQAALREQSLTVFDRTFRITGVLRTLAMIVAMIGVLGALMAHELERVRELGLLRASGMTRGQLWLLVTTQTGLIGLVAGLLALPVGMAMAAMTTLIINQRSFGWTIPLEVDYAILGQAVLASVVAALAAGVLPSIRMATTSPAEALRSE